MKPDVPLFTGGHTILEDQDQTVLDVVKSISGNLGQEDPFFVLDVGDIVQKVKNWKLHLPRVQPFYAVKCNDHSAVLEVLAALGTGFDCASKGEMRKIIDMGVSPDRIIFAHPCKPISHIRTASKLAINLMTFDNEAELHKIKAVMPDASLVLRIRCDALKAQCPLGIKFGAQPEDVPGLLDLAKELGLNIVGVSFHVGSGCGEPEVFLRAIEASREVFDEEIARGFKPYLLDIGGGYPGHGGSSLAEIAHFINTGLDLYFPDESEVEVIAEPGRYMVASAFTLCTQIVSKRRVDASEGADADGYMYYVNDGLYGSFNCVLYDHQEVAPYPIKSIPLKKPLLASSIWGPTCDGLDQVVEKVYLPPLNLGDWLVWDNMGAYTLAAAGTFNGFPIPNVHCVMQEHIFSFLHGLVERRKLQLAMACNDGDRVVKMLSALDDLDWVTVADI